MHSASLFSQLTQLKNSVELYNFNHPAKVQCTKITKEDFLFDNGEIAEELIRALRSKGFKTYYYNLHYSKRKPNSVNLCFIRSPRHCLGFYEKSDGIRIEMLYRVCEYNKNRRYKARNLLKRFILACEEAGVESLTLEPLEFALTPRLSVSVRGFTP